MEFHECHEAWILVVGIIFQCQKEPGNIADKHTVPVIKKDKVGEHLMNGKSGKFAKAAFFFRMADTNNSAEVNIAEKRINNGIGMGIM